MRNSICFVSSGFRPATWPASSILIFAASTSWVGLSHSRSQNTPIRRVPPRQRKRKEETHTASHLPAQSQPSTPSCLATCVLTGPWLSHALLGPLESPVRVLSLSSLAPPSLSHCRLSSPRKETRNFHSAKWSSARARLQTLDLCVIGSHHRHCFCLSSLFLYGLSGLEVPLLLTPTSLIPLPTSHITSHLTHHTPTHT